MNTVEPNKVEWVVVKETGQVAIVHVRKKNGVEIEFPQSQERANYSKDKVDPFDPREYPVQMSPQARNKLRDNGIVPKSDEKKVCNKCFKLKQIEDFAINQTRKDGSQIRRPTCTACRSGIDGVRNLRTNKQGVLIEPPEIGTWWKCPICEKRGIVGVTVKIVIDHDHLTGHAREAICDSCNTGLGRFRNGKLYLQNAIDYVLKWEGD